MDQDHHTHRKSLHTAITIALLAVLSGCSGPPTPPTKAPTRAPERELTAGEVLQKAWTELSNKKIFSAEATVRRMLAVNPSHLEGQVFIAMLYDMSGDEADAADVWSRVEELLVYRGKLETFVLQQTLLAAGIHYLRLDKPDRAKLFLDELWRRYPNSTISTLAHLKEAEVAAAKNRWNLVVTICDDLHRTQPNSDETRTCRQLQQLGARLMTVGPEPPRGAPAWSWVHPLPQGNTLRDLWVFPSGEAYAVGDAGTLLRRAPEDKTFTVLPRLTRWPLHGVCGLGDDKAYAVGGGGVVLELSAGQWEVIRQPKPTYKDLYAAYAPSAGYLVAVGDAGRVVTLNDGKWSTQTVTDVPLYGVWGAGSDRVVAVGKGGITLRSNGNGWKTVPSDSYEDLMGVWSADANQFFAVGKRKTVAVCNNGSWKETVAGSSDNHDVFGLSADKVWVVGAGGTVLRSAGKGRWVSEKSGTLLTLLGVSGSSEKDLWAVGSGGTILQRRNNRRGWTLQGGGFGDTLVGICTPAAGEVLALGSRGTLLAHKGERWSRTRLPAGAYTDLWCDDKRAAAVGRRGLLALRGKGSRRWKPVKTDVPYDLLQVAGYPGGMVAVGARGTILRIQGTKVTRDKSPTGHDLNGVWAASSRQMMAVGYRGTVLAFNGGGWVRQDTGVLFNISAVWGYRGSYFAAGEGGRILRFQGKRWREMTSPTSQELVSIAGAGGTDVVAVSSRGGVIHFDGQTWTPHRSPASCLTRVARTPAGDYQAVGCFGTIIRWKP